MQSVPWFNIRPVCPISWTSSMSASASVREYRHPELTPPAFGFISHIPANLSNKIGILVFPFLGGLSLHLNHLIASRTAITIGYLWHFLLDFLPQIWTQGTLRHILGPILVIFEICQFLTIPGPFEYFSENGWSQKIKVFSMKEQSLHPLSV